MRLIDADALTHEAEHCIETTDAFIEMIKKSPTIIQDTDVTLSIILPSNVIDYIKDVEYIPDVYAGVVLRAILDGINGINGS